MQPITLHRSLSGFVLGIALALTLSLQGAVADTSLPPFSGDFSAISVAAVADGTQAILAPSSPAAGPLIYDDFKLLEAQARQLLKQHLAFRESISPYGDKSTFDTLVRQFDYTVGFSRNYSGTQTLQARIDQADQELRIARNIYGYLAVYAPEVRFRADPAYITLQPGEGVSRCGANDQENPNPPDPTNSGQVLPPVIDWCNFTARLRQSVREAANIRMIFAQQFMVDALGLHFSGTEFYGGIDFVRAEVAKLRAAKQQYALAEQGLAEALGYALGSGCYLSDFYMQPEWSLLSRAAEGQTTAGHHIGVRLSYLESVDAPGAASPQAAAQASFRAATVDGYIKLIGTASLGTEEPLGPGCNQGKRPDGLLAAEMAVNLLNTRQAARQLADGRNIFGFDVTFTPARPYRTAPGSSNTGLWDEALTAAKYAQQLQKDETAASRAFDQSQQGLLQTVEGIRQNNNQAIADLSGCNRNSFTDDAQWFACIDAQIHELNLCLKDVQTPKIGPDIPIPDKLIERTPFDDCMERTEAGKPLILTSEAQRLLIDLHTIYVQMVGTTIKANNINKRVELSSQRFAIVKKSLIVSGAAQTVAAVAETFVEGVTCTAGDLFSAAVNAGVCGAATVANATAQAFAGAESTIADITIEDADTNKEVENLLLDMSELLIDQLAARQQFRSKQSEFDGLLGDLDDAVIEAQRQRDYLNLSPGNDPSFRIVRDSARLVLAKQLEYAARVSYLAARRAEYEYAARLAASNFRISDIYRARTADDIIRFLQNLAGVTNNLAGSISDAQLTPADFKISVALHVRGLTDAALAQEGFTEPQAIQAERLRRFRLWVAQNTRTGSDGKPQLRFSFPTSVLEEGIFSDLLQQGYDRFWLHKLAGVGLPKSSNTGVSVNLRTDQPGSLSFRSVSITQSGVSHLRAFSGCIFDYRLIAPSVLLGQEWPAGQPAESATAVFRADINGAHGFREPGYQTSDFLGRPVSATDWLVVVYAGTPTVGLPDLDLQQLTDIELNFSTTYASRQPTMPQLSECTRIDY